MAPLIAPDYWMNSQLSIARFYGAIIIRGESYVIHSPTGYLVKEDLIKYIDTLNFETVKKAVQRYGDSPKTHKVLSRLQKIIKARKRAEKLNAQAEVERAKGAAEAIKIENGSITPTYIQYLWVRQQNANVNNKIIYIPTEAGLPILEAKGE